MDITIQPGKLSGIIQAIPSKSQAHRFLICAALADSPTIIMCPETNRDMDATADCLNAIGASVKKDQWGYTVKPIQNIPHYADLNCHDSGSTLRFMLPIVGALGIDATFHLKGRLPQRPLSPLWEEMERMGCSLSRPSDVTIRCQGKLVPGSYNIDGSVSSQFITGLMLALPLIPGSSVLTVTGNLESRPYVDMTKEALNIFGLSLSEDGFSAVGQYRSPGHLSVEGDWSNGAFFLTAKELGNSVAVENLNADSVQGDRAVLKLLAQLHNHCTISAADIPDLVPILSLAAACCRGAVFTNIRRLRLKESDRVATVIQLLESLGGKAEATEDTLTVFGTGLHGGTVDSANDHRIAMTAAIAATVCSKPVTILGAQCVEKSYPEFWEEYRRLGGQYEQHLW